MLRGWRQANSAYGPNQQQIEDLPPNMSLLPLYIMGMIKSPSLRGGNVMSLDQRAYIIGKIVLILI